MICVYLYIYIYIYIYIFIYIHVFLHPPCARVRVLARRRGSDVRLRKCDASYEIRMGMTTWLMIGQKWKNNQCQGS